MSLPTYERYKDSDVSWLGNVPAHWEVAPARRVFEQRRDASLPEDEQLSATQRFGVIPQRLFMETQDQKVVLALSGTGSFKHVQKNDFVISLRSFQGGIERSSYDGCVSPAYTVLRATHSVVPDFWTYALKCSSYVAALQTVTEGIRDGKNISYGQFGGLEVPIPPTDEQGQIALFLDRETAKIDALIAEQEKLLALLAEKRQATISHAVTRGLDPNVPMKDSGIAWLGEVPAHWEVLPVKRATSSIEQGWSPQCENFPVESADEWGVLKVGCVNGGVFNSAENKKLPDDLEPVVCYALSAGDLLVSRANTRDLVGSAAVVPEDCRRLLLCDKLYRLRLDSERCDPWFAAAFLGTGKARSQIELEATGASSSMLNIGQSVILAMPVPLPPIEEQRRIMRFVADEVSLLERLQREARRAIDVLKERRSALIAAAVTGQIDVRAIASASPQQQQEIAPCPSFA